MPKSVLLGEFEQLVMLTILELDEKAYAINLRNRLNEIAGRTVSRGALYRTLDRLSAKGYVGWEIETDAPDRSGHPRRNFYVSKRGVEMLRLSREKLMGLWDGLKGVFE